jgi:hypothetical protein
MFIYLNFFFKQEEYLHSLNQLEIATTELNTVTQQYNHSKDKLESFKRDNKKAIELFNEQMNILCKLFYFLFIKLILIKLEISLVFSKHLIFRIKFVRSGRLVFLVRSQKS